MPVDPKIIYLETDEEVTSIVDKLRKTEFKSVVLVIPKEATIIQSVINLKLLKRQAEILDKKLIIATQDKVGRKLAEKVGLAASAKVDEAIKNSEFVPVPMEEAVEFEEESSKQKKENDPLMNTDEVIFKKEKTSKEKPVKEIDDEDDIVLREEDETIGTEEEDGWKKKEVETSNSDNLMPKFPLKKTAIIFTVLILFLFGLAVIFIPRAKATVKVEAERKAVSINFTGEKDGSLDTDRSVIPTQLVEVTKEVSKKYNATGKKNIGNKAAGTLRIANSSGQNINWISGTRFAPTNNPSLVYTANSAVFAPDGQFTSIIVTAAQPGEEYNGFGNNQSFTLVAGGLSSTVAITSKDGMTGGSNKEVTYVTQADFNSAKESLSKDATEDAVTEFNKKVENLKVVDDTKKTEVVSIDSTPDVNAEASEFNLAVKINIKSLAYNLDDISKLVKAEVERQLSFSKDIIDDGAKEADIVVEESDLSKVSMTGTIKTSAYVSSKFDENQIKDELVGKNQEQAKKYLEGLEGIEEVQTDFFPSFFKYFPRLKDHIILKIEVAEKGN